ncbi:hypothetical protein N7G274_009403 [Stereocaulon virgatum]|uniref:Peptidase M20 dimerisation domain-containing protein n=1 Tax=Stereocaulon virgatum TaxID=373712 RepID=A0ABR4A3M1_9LECA
MMVKQGFADLLAEKPDLEKYEALYKHFHSHPELSLQENQTASTIFSHLESLEAGYELHTSIGGHGLAGVLRNGSGPKVLLRADIDALPVLEQTGLPYASKVTMKDVADGVEKPVMHACGHDMHITCLLAAAEQLAGVKSAWTGTLIVLFQPNEERGGGAQAMVDNALYEKIPKPDFVLGQHVMPLRAGRIGNRAGTIMGAADSFKVTLFGRGGHGSMPHRSIDPVVMAANVVLRLQNIVSREINPADAAVVTVGSVQAGQTENVIADRAVLRLNTRTTTPATRDRVLAAIRRIIKAECEASNSPKAPLIEPTSRFPLTINDKDVASRLASSFGEFFGKDFNPETASTNGSEDVSILATSIDRPYNFWFFGGVDPELWDRAESEGRLFEDVPANHSCYFAPVVQPTLTVGFEALCVGALTLLGKK